MTILTFPSSLLPSRATWGIKSNTQQFTSPLNGSTKTVSRMGARWKAALDFNSMSIANARLMKAFLSAMDGMAGRCYLYPHDNPGTGASVNVNGASQTGSTLIIDGAAAGRVFSAGDYFAVNDELKILIADATADGSGNATLNFMPPFRASPADNAVVTFTQPKALMMIAQDEWNMSRLPGDNHDQLSIPFVEVFQ